MSNVSLIALGINEVREGSAIVEGGIAHIAEGILNSWFTPLRWSYGSGDNEVSGCTNLGDMFKYHEGGDNFVKAMYRSVAENFGVDGEMLDADKMAFKRGFSVAAARHAGVPVEFVDTEVKRKGRSVKVRAVQVPASVAFKLTTEDGEATEQGKKMIAAIQSNAKLFDKRNIPDNATALEQAKAYEVECVGGREGIVGKVPSSTDISKTLNAVAVEAGLMKAPRPRNSAARSAKFGESLDFVIKSLDLLASGVDESEFAPSDALEAKMRECAERLAAYFAA